MSTPNIRVTDRDLILFRYLFEHDFLTRKIIKEYIWKELSNQYVTHRLWRMRKEDYVRKKPHPLKQKGSIIMPSEKTFNLIQNSSILNRYNELQRNDKSTLYPVSNYPNIHRYWKIKDEINLATFDHNRFLAEVRLTFEDVGKGDYWLAEKILWKKLYNEDIETVPDGTFQYNDKLVAIELENTIKRPCRYRKIFTEYTKYDQIDTVLYITTNDNIYNKLQSHLKAGFINHDPSNWYKKFYVGSLDDVLSGNFVFSNNKNGTIKL